MMTVSIANRWVHHVYWDVYMPCITMKAGAAITHATRMHLFLPHALQRELRHLLATIVNGGAASTIRGGGVSKAPAGASTPSRHRDGANRHGTVGVPPRPGPEAAFDPLATAPIPGVRAPMPPPSRR